MYWYYYESSTFNIDKEMPFLKLLLDMASLRMKYYREINASPIGIPQIIVDVGKESTMIIRSFIKIKSLGEDLFSTGHILTIDYCMELFRMFQRKEMFDYFFWRKLVGD